MTLKLPRPYKPRLPFHEQFLLRYLEGLAHTGDGILDTAAAIGLAASSLHLTADHIAESLASLNGRRCILLGSKQFAILSRLSTNLKQERDRNRIRSKRGGCPPDWSLHRRAAAAFPALRGPIDRPASYNKPAAFEPILKQHLHHHRKECPPDVEILTEAFYPGELTSVLTFIEEQRSANRTVVLLYTRKAVYVGVQRAPKR